MTDTSELEIIENAPRPMPALTASSTERMISACAGALVTATFSKFQGLMTSVWLMVASDTSRCHQDKTPKPDIHRSSVERHLGKLPLWKVGGGGG